jgi:ferredoxin
MIDQAIAKEDCTGCKMCADACPKTAISFGMDGEGFWYPQVNNERCVRCGICVKKCPVLTPCPPDAAHTQHPAVYAAKANEESLRRASTSGGVFGVLARAVLKQGGVVAGAAWDETLHVRHMIIHSEAQLPELQGVKYVQSDTTEIYRTVKAHLDAGETVLFSGTTCQNAALCAYLGRGYDNLIQCDFVCHGVPSPGAWESYKQMQERLQGAPLSALHFRDKTVSWSESGVRTVFADGKEIFASAQEDPWMQAYLRAKALVRPSCFACPFKALPRITDLTLADFWGVAENVDPALDDGLGVSAVLVHTPKGRALLEQAAPDLLLHPTTLDAMKKENACLLENATPGVRREAFLAALEKQSFDTALRRALRPTLRQRVNAGTARAKALLPHKKEK